MNITDAEYHRLRTIEAAAYAVAAPGSIMQVIERAGELRRLLAANPPTEAPQQIAVVATLLPKQQITSSE